MIRSALALACLLACVATASAQTILAQPPSAIIGGELWIPHSPLPDVPGMSIEVTLVMQDASGLPVIPDPSLAHVVHSGPPILDAGCGTLWPIIPTYLGPRTDLHLTIRGVDDCAGWLPIRFAPILPAMSAATVTGLVRFRVVPHVLFGADAIMTPSTASPIETSAAETWTLFAEDVMANGWVY
jgi:hypothetical protein